jgi:acetate kinase
MFMGIELGPPRSLGDGIFEITKPESRVTALVIPTNEELMIARDTLAVIRKNF